MTTTKDHAVAVSEAKEGWVPLNTSAEIFAGDFVIAIPGTSLADDGADTSGAVCVGIATRYSKQSALAAPAQTNAYVQVKYSGIARVKASGLATTDVGKLAYIYQNDTVKVSGVTNYVCVGKIVKYISATECDIDLDQRGTLVVAGAIPGGTITAAMLASDAVTTVKILAANVTHAKLADDAVETHNIKDANVTLAKLASGITPAFIVVAADNSVATAGGDATETVTISGVTATDVAIVTLKVKGSTPRTILTAACTTDTLTVVFSDDPSTDHEFAYVILRAAA